MNTNQKATGWRFSMWIGIAFALGVILGIVVTIVGLIVLQALISYAQ